MQPASDKALTIPCCRFTEISFQSPLFLRLISPTESAPAVTSSLTIWATLTLDAASRIISWGEVGRSGDDDVHHSASPGLLTP
jgi:hypothetical protein